MTVMTAVQSSAHKKNAIARARELLVLCDELINKAR